MKGAGGFVSVFAGVQILCFWISFAVLASFTTHSYSGGVIVAQVGFGNFLALATDHVFQKALLDSFVLAASAAIGSTLLALIFVLAAFECVGARVRTALIVSVCAMIGAGTIARVYSLEFLLSAEGSIGPLWKQMGLADGLLYTRTGIVIGYLAILTPFSTAALFVARRQVPAKYLDAGRDLGAGTSELIWSVVIPGMRAGLLVSILLTFLLAFTDVIVTDLVGGARVYTVASAILDYVRINDWGYASSAGIAALAGVAVMLGLFGSALRGASADAA